MNCNPGDIAQVVAPHTIEHGWIVTCLRYQGSMEYKGHPSQHTDLWVIDVPVSWKILSSGERFKAWLIPDKFLRPYPKFPELEHEKEPLARELC